MSTYAPGKGRQSGITPPGKSTGIPVPGGVRSRAPSSAGHNPPLSSDNEYASRAFSDAIKAYDPAQHRHGRYSDVSGTSLSPPYNGRQSVTGRPSSVASSTSAVSSAPLRATISSSRTTTHRPPSRQSDVIARSASRTGRPFEVGDNVRIESLGFEGTLRYLGEIDGKPGHWAGVELNGAFVGKGKNNGTVSGKSYFVCLPNCGVFVASTKLSAPTADYTSSSRPSSVASSRHGRMTPSIPYSGFPASASATMPAGRKTPSVSLSNGRITPSISNGRGTPAASTGRRTPAIRPISTRSGSAGSARMMKMTTPTKTAPPHAAITPGSRASKYVGMTAKQLGSRVSAAARSGNSSPSRSTGFSPTQRPGHVSSPTSPFATPKPPSRTSIGIGMPSPTSARQRTSLSTPRARVLSSVALPPPASLSSTSLMARSISMTEANGDVGLLSDLQQSGKALQDQIAELMSGKVPPNPRPESSASTSSSSVFPTSISNAFELQNQVEILQSRLDAMEDENKRLRTATEKFEAAEQETASRIERISADQKQGAARVVELEAQARNNERTLSERDTTIESLERAAKQTTADIDKIKSEFEARVRDVQSKLDDKEALVTNLKELLEEKEGLQTENDAVVRAKDAEITLLEARVQKAYVELEEERKELGGQVDELRNAGQETIALYEERLSTADSQRYELEDLVASLQEQLRAQDRPPSPTTAHGQAITAVEIDNEALREQVQHLQKRIAALEDQLEDAHATLEKEEAAAHERMVQFTDREDGLHKELAAAKEETQQVIRSEKTARQRIEELDEALRESKVALENARAEIEGLRSEIADLESINSIASGDEKINAVIRRSAADRTRFMEEIEHLKHQLCESRSEHPHDVSTPIAGPAEIEPRIHELTELLEKSKTDTAELHGQLAESKAERDSAHAEVAALQSLVDERTAELENLRKKVNREIPVNGIESGKASSSKHDISSARDEITGLKCVHIVQELQMENSAQAQRNKALEQENNFLLSETDQLRQELKTLEENVEQSFMREEESLAYAADGAGSAEDIVKMQKKHETELEQLRKKLVEAERTSARTIHDLNKEISELETLIESKIYREEELESEIEKLKDKLARSQKKMSRSSVSTPTSATPSVSASSSSTSTPNLETVCEICERPGHDIFTCDLLKDEGAPLGMDGGLMTEGLEGLEEEVCDEELICEDCEGRGHLAANCPHSLDVF
ncbi:uncharacterized protein LAESUDRAFT_693618 [Laetiporus sulphureus 93-53]|uniref:CAP-Gly domain-containing protein n=1 Tax=Laetiporus sulphureus 93-53 TaxID=1314785 RepID=A0A165H064_9APHY|nr:uncharacterized protein LAESUDRAFT_693618 [Laetiporus sulphureus 93-53]KZT11066.1 hypothetical protein LAESUDRAFT_693618 [Laetiporus sulphureus 93-53]